MRVSVTHHLNDLERDCRVVGASLKPAAEKIIAQKILEGSGAARRLARAASGPHGANYYKRITSGMTGTLKGEWGPTGDVAGNAVGAGWRHGPGNMDLPNSADIIAPEFQRDIGNLLGRMFWPGGDR
jgi:hypothetical protein